MLDEQADCRAESSSLDRLCAARLAELLPSLISALEAALHSFAMVLRETHPLGIEH